MVQSGRNTEVQQFTHLHEDLAVQRINGTIIVGLSLRFDSHVAMIFPPLTNLLLYELIASTIGMFTHNNKGPDHECSTRRGTTGYTGLDIATNTVAFAT